MVGFRIPRLVCSAIGEMGEAIDVGTNALTTHRPPGPALTVGPLKLPSAIMRMVVVPTGGGTATGTASDATPTRLKSHQASVSTAFSYGGHHYFGQHGPGDPPREAALQYVGAYTLQFHEDNLKGWELQFLVQLQDGQLGGVDSPTSLAAGAQASYVWQLVRDRVQVSAFVQALVGGVVSTPRSGAQVQLSGGPQLTISPSKKIQLTAQFSASFTLQRHGPLSADPTGAVGVVLPF